MNNCSDNSTIIYNKVFNNNYLKKYILNYLHIYNILNINVEFDSLEEWESYKFKEYLHDVTFQFSYDITLLPVNIKRVTISHRNSIKTDQAIQVPEWIESISLKAFNPINLKSEYFKSISSKLTSLETISDVFESNYGRNQFEPNSLPNSITSLYIRGILINPIRKNVFPSNLKKLNVIGTPIERGALIQSLTDISISGSVPLALNELSELNNLKRLFLWIECLDNIIIDNKNNFPKSLEELYINAYIFSASLPINLKMLTLYVDVIKDEIVFPSSLEFLNLSYSSCSDKVKFNHKTLPKSLKSLAISNSTIANKKVLSSFPVALEMLRFNLNKQIEAKLLPSSLTYIDFGHNFSQAIQVKVLPANLKQLVLGESYNQEINPLAIPKSLELLKIKNYNYNHRINLINNPDTIIDCFILSLYYRPEDYKSSPERLHVLKIPHQHNLPLSTLKLQDKSNLHYLSVFSQDIKSEDLPINNNIKTLEFDADYSIELNLELFKNVETIKINSIISRYFPKITTTIDENGNSNFYSLKNIIIPSKLSINPSKLIKYIDPTFFKFLSVESNIANHFYK